MKESNFNPEKADVENPMQGKNFPLDMEDEKLIQNYTNALKDLDSEKERVAFKNIITSKDRCGFASSGTLNYLLNTDPYRRFTVTVRTYWTRGIDRGEFDKLYPINAGQKILLGCTESSVIPVTSYRRVVVGEVVHHH